ncbi:MAG: hypothetical protein N2C14_17370 [Planctomycetales bacterium]
MNKYEFRLILKGRLELTEEIADALFECGCDDGTPGTCDGVFSIDFHRQGDSLEAAIHSAIKNVKSAGHDVERVEIEAATMPQPSSRNSDVASIVKNLAVQDWKWNREGIDAILASLGWSKGDSVLHRDAYTLIGGLDASVYYDGHRPDLIEIEKEVFEEVTLLDDLNYEDKIDRFHKMFLGETEQISDYLGDPVFSDGATATGFPDDQDAVWLSLWNVPTARLMLQVKHEDRDLPIRLCVLVAQPQ